MKFIRDFKGIQILATKAKQVLPYSLAVGQVTSVKDETTREVKILKMEMNEYLKMYFNKSFNFVSVDSMKESRVGDIVLIKKLTDPPTNEKLFGIEKILFKRENIIDPITGRSNNFESNILNEHIESLKGKIF